MTSAFAATKCEQLHRLCAQCIYLISVSEAEQGSGNKQMLCPICKQTIRKFEDLANNEEEITKAFLNMNITKKMRADMPKLQLADELHVELMHFLDMESLQKMLLVSRLPYAYFGKQLRKWKARNEWVYSMSAFDQWYNAEDKAKKCRILSQHEINQHGLTVCKGKARSIFTNVFAKKHFELPKPTDDDISAITATTIRRFYFEIRVNKTTGPILFGLAEQQFFKPLDHYQRIILLDEDGEEIDIEDHAHFDFLEYQQYFANESKPFYLGNDIAAWQDHIEQRRLRSFARRNLFSATDGGKFTDGDVLGCGLLLFPQQKMMESVQEEGTNGITTDDAMARNCQLFFTKNGHLIGEPTWVSPVYGDELFPFVGLVSEGTSVTGNFGDLEKFPLLYNIGQHNSPLGTE